MRIGENLDTAFSKIRIFYNKGESAHVVLPCVAANAVLRGEIIQMKKNKTLARGVIAVLCVLMAASVFAQSDDNIIRNGSFTEADLGPWAASQGGASISVGKSDVEIAPGITEYGIINGRTQPWESFAQDITASVSAGDQYAYEFWAMLSSDYEGKPSDQRQIDFAPYITTTDGNTAYLGSYSAEITGAASQQLTPGKWTKFSGTFKIQASGEIKQVVIRIIEQGTNYGSGICVLGEYYVAGVSMTPIWSAPKSIQEDLPDLRDAVAAEMGSQFLAGTSLTQSELADPLVMGLVTKHFNAVTLGNELKPDAIFNYSNERCPGTTTAVLNGEELVVPVMNFSRAEAMLNKIKEWNDANPDKFIRVRGHVLTWHSQTPNWFFYEDYDTTKPLVSKELMTKRHEWYIKSVLEHFVGPDSPYKDMFYGWDVVNEAVSDASGYRKDGMWWLVYKSEEYIVNAFKFANKYAPANLELYYNDYNDTQAGKVDDICTLLSTVKAAEGAPGVGTRIDGFGMQGHYSMASPDGETFAAAARKYAAIVGQIQLTELDFKASASYTGAAEQKHEEFSNEGLRYLDLYNAMKTLVSEGVHVGGFTVWGVVDKNSWLHQQTGRYQSPLLFDDNYQAKPAYWAFVDESKIDRIIKAPKLVPIIGIKKGTPKINGKQDIKWWFVKKIPLEINLGAEASAWVKLMWDEENLYVFAHVEDACLNADSADDYQQDSFEIFIDERCDRATSYKGDDKQYRISFQNKQSFNGESCTADNIVSAVRVTKKGYNIEAAIKWTEIEPSIGRQFGIELQVNDAGADGTRLGTLSWYDDTGDGWENPSVFGYAIFQKKSSLTEDWR